MLSPDVRRQLLAIAPIPDEQGQRVLRPACARMRDGTLLERVIFTDAGALKRKPRAGDLGYAIWPSEVVAVEPSPTAVTWTLAAQLSRIGERGMGWRVATVTLRDGRQFTWGISER